MKNRVKGVRAILAGLIIVGSVQTLNLSKAGLEQCLDKMAAALGGKHERKEEC
jgi:hypothetical protein